jgi:hypothetical protein
MHKRLLRLFHALQLHLTQGLLVLFLCVISVCCVRFEKTPRQCLDLWINMWCIATFWSVPVTPFTSQGLAVAKRSPSARNETVACSTKAIVIVPYVVLYDELKRRFDDIDLPAQICANGVVLDPTKRVYIVGINTFSMDEMHTQVRHLAQQGNLGAVLIDEADGIIADSWRRHYEWAYKYVLQLPKTVLGICLSYHSSPA